MDIFDQWPMWLFFLAVIALIAMIIAAVFVFIKFVRTFKLIQSEHMPMGGKLAFWGTVLYLFSPVDLLPDPILVDDIGVMLAAAAFITKLASDQGIDASTIGKVGREVFGAINDTDHRRTSSGQQNDHLDVDHADHDRLNRDVEDIIDIPPT